MTQPYPGAGPFGFSPGVWEIVRMVYMQNLHNCQDHRLSFKWRNYTGVKCCQCNLILRFEKLLIEQVNIEELAEWHQLLFDNTPLRGRNRHGKRLPRQDATNSVRYHNDSHGLRGRYRRPLKPALIEEIPFEKYGIVN
jgi:hypothetical protein